MPRTFFARTFGNNTGGVCSPPAAPTLAVSDNADGTGGVATITGADAGATVTVYSQAVDGELGTATWTSRGSRVGNGTVAVNPGNGYYWWRAIAATSGGESISNLVYQPMTSGTTAVFYRALTGVQSRIQGLALAGVANSSVVVRKLPWNRNVVKPGIFITPATESMDPLAGVNTRDDVGYAIQVVWVRASNEDLTTAIDTWLKWREQVARAFRNQRLPGVAEIIRIVVEPATVFLPAAFESLYDVQAVVVRCISREVRGI